MHFSSYNALSDVFVNHVLDHKYFGGICEYIYNGEWRELTYDSFCEHLYYNDDEKYFRKPYNFLSYRTMAHSLSQGSTETYSDAASLLTAQKTESSYNWGFTFGIMYVESGPSASHSEMLLKNLTQYNSKDVEFIRLLSTVETAQFKMRSRDLMLHEDMLQSLMELPEQYDFGAYSRFINDYGTHYVTQGTMGGVLDYVVVLNKKGLPIYELVRFSTAASQARTRIPLLKQAWEEYMQQFNPCRCAPCRNNGVPVLSKTSCSCLCKQGYDGLASGPVHGSWSCWSSWSSCSSGTKTRKRECNNPTPKDGGFQCGGNSVQTKRC
ncbi:hypothetical protein QTP70_007740 [Hemibagrus guttatus]|uniref:MACPF domain-containing protein n=1 Tax=Hemibagrus guttatus TaxID=175788 RepID=A0AAE0R790_9TELE|nr:hypothetical protein QTP70_007740 [Hemibagrus guttatus]KAK3566881.1 hypothetical protein QTP86_004767 [Hemibagrus guttatus]